MQSLLGFQRIRAHSHEEAGQPPAAAQVRPLHRHGERGRGRGGRRSPERLLRGLGPRHGPGLLPAGVGLGAGGGGEAAGGDHGRGRPRQRRLRSGTEHKHQD